MSILKMNNSSYLASVDVLMLIFAVKLWFAEVALVLPVWRKSSAATRSSEGSRHPGNTVGTFEKPQDASVSDVSEVGAEIAFILR